jgi:hypothetical protein
LFSTAQGMLDLFEKRDEASVAAKCARAGVAPSRDQCDAKRHPKGQGLQLQNQRTVEAHATQAAKWCVAFVSFSPLYSDAKVANANRDGRDFGWEIAHAAVSRRFPSTRL